MQSYIIRKWGCWHAFWQCESRYLYIKYLQMERTYLGCRLEANFLRLNMPYKRSFFIRGGKVTVWISAWWWVIRRYISLVALIISLCNVAIAIPWKKEWQKVTYACGKYGLLPLSPQISIKYQSLSGLF